MAIQAWSHPGVRQPSALLGRRRTGVRVKANRVDGTHMLPDGMTLEKIVMTPHASNGRPPLLFVHGSYHGAWCWAEKFQPYFADRGYTSVSVSFRAQAKSERADGMKFAGTLKTHADDLESVVRSMDAAPVMIAHSFGGLVAELYASQSSRAPLAGIGLLASVPPTGNGEIIKRITKRSFVDSAKITWGFITKSFLRSTKDTRFLFFSEALDESLVLKYQRLLQENASTVPLLDVRNLNAELPIAAPDRATYSNAFVGGGSADCVVDLPAVEDLARHFGVKPIIWDGLAHDVMLDADWEVVAADLNTWLESL